MAAAALVSVAGIAAALVLGSPQAVESRLVAASTGAAILVAWLAAAIANVARLRFFSPDAIDAGSAGRVDSGEAVLRAGAILQNTLEQVVLAIPAYIGLALLLNRSTAVIATCAGLFCAGRMLFWAGYGRGAVGRATGFALTFYPSVAALLIVLGTAVASTVR